MVYIYTTDQNHDDWRMIAILKDDFYIVLPTSIDIPFFFRPMVINFQRPNGSPTRFMDIQVSVTMPGLNKLEDWKEYGSWNWLVV